jgi:hypothetical protein
MSRSENRPRREAPDGSGHGAANWGVSVGSGNVISGAVASGGYQGRVSQSVTIAGGDGTAAARLEQLLSRLADGLHDLGGADAADALDDVDRVREELGRRRPDASRVRDLMDRIAQVVEPAAALVAVANQARELIVALLH